MTKRKFTIEYEEHPGGLWVKIKGKRYLLSHTGGEFVPTNEQKISDFYWEDMYKNPEIVNQIFKEIANQFS